MTQPDMGKEARALIWLATPAVLTQLGTQVMGVIDVAMVGRLGPEALGQAALGDLWGFGTLILGMGLAMGIDPLVSQAHGARHASAAGRSFQWGLVIAVASTIPIALLWLATSPILQWLGQEPALADGASKYLRVQLFGIAPFLVFMTMRQFLQARALPMAPLWVIGMGIVVNVLLNWVLIFGNLGAPAMGVEGAGLATGLTRTVMAVALALLIFHWRLHRGAWVAWSRASFAWQGIVKVLRYGLPVSAALSLESWAFNAAALFAGWLGAEALAAHSIVNRMASLSFMIPLGVALAATARVGNQIGAGRPHEAQAAAWVSMILGGGCMVVSAAVFIAWRHQLPGLFIESGPVVALAASALPVVAAFQVFDGLQVVGGGILRGMGTPRPAAFYAFIGYFVLGLPLSWSLAFPGGMGLRGIWWGLCLGLGTVAVLLVIRIARRGPARMEGIWESEGGSSTAEVPVAEKKPEG